jgi:hypothetical protein
MSPGLDADARRELLTVLTAEHANLQAARSAGMLEANGRTTAFFAALSGSLVALALGAQVPSLAGLLAGIATLLVVTVLYIGIVTFIRLAQLAQLDSLLVLGINRVRHAYLDLVPSLAAVEVLSAYDDLPGILGGTGLTGRSSSRLDLLVASPGMVASVDGILAGVVVGLVAVQLGAAGPASLIIGVIAGIATDVLLVVYGVRSSARFWRAHPPSHPMPKG